jgi:hypothetical protein
MKHEGNLIIANADDALKYRDVTDVMGHLYIKVRACLPALKNVGGDLHSYEHAAADLPSLTIVAGRLYLRGNANLPALTISPAQ